MVNLLWVTLAWLSNRAVSYSSIEVKVTVIRSSSLASNQAICASSFACIVAITWNTGVSNLSLSNRSALALSWLAKSNLSMGMVAGGWYIANPPSTRKGSMGFAMILFHIALWF